MHRSIQSQGFGLPAEAAERQRQVREMFADAAQQIRPGTSALRGTLGPQKTTEAKDPNIYIYIYVWYIYITYGIESMVYGI